MSGARAACGATNQDLPTTLGAGIHEPEGDVVVQLQDHSQSSANDVCNDSKDDCDARNATFRVSMQSLFSPRNSNELIFHTIWVSCMLNGGERRLFTTRAIDHCSIWTSKSTTTVRRFAPSLSAGYKGSYEGPGIGGVMISFNTSRDSRGKREMSSVSSCDDW